MLLGIEIEVNPENSKADSPMEVTELGMVIDAKPEHLAKHLVGIAVIEFGIIMEVKFVQNSNPDSPIEITELGMETEFKLLHLEKLL